MRIINPQLEQNIKQKKPIKLDLGSGGIRMYYFVALDKLPNIRKNIPSFYSDVRFHIESINIEFHRSSICDKLLARCLTNLVNRNIHWQNFYERRLCHLFHAQQIRYILKPDKEYK